MSHRTNGRDIAVMLLLDLSESLNEKVAGSDQTILELSQEAVSLLAWAIDKLGDPFAIARLPLQHPPRRALPAHQGLRRTLGRRRQGAAGRDGGGLLHPHGRGHAPRRALPGTRQADKKLMLILTDGEPSDVDVHDERLLIEDARQAVKELDQQGIFTYCINLDPKADEYVGDIFGRQYTVIDRIERLPERLPQLFMALTK